ncbi:MAG: TonB-dependent receptor [Bacteroides sp.]|nr:TonB-dependent receptor [Bacteroides sp.]
MKTKLLLYSFLLIMHGGKAFAQDPTDIISSTSKDPLPGDSIEGSYYDLEDVVIAVEKPLVQTDGATLTYNMEEDPSAKGNTLIDALRKVPMVTIDGENNIRINGQENFKIYVNGKEDPALSANYKNILRAMPAEAVSKIEVITEPGAKYDAEGTAGILNLITIKKDSSDGYSGSLSANFSKSNYGASLYGRLKKKRLSMSANIDFANGDLFPQINNNEFYVENLNSTDSRFQKTNMHQEVKFKYIGGGLNLSYDLSDKDLITANGNIHAVRPQFNNAFTSTETFAPDMTMTSYLFRVGKPKLTFSGLTAGASWQHDFSKPGHKTILSYQYNHGFNRILIDFLTKEQTGLTIIPVFERQDSKEYNNEHTIQLDYINPFTDIHTLEAGIKGVFRRNDANAHFYYGSDRLDATESLSDRTDLIQIQDVFAGYATYSGKFGNLSTNAGLRYEHTRMGIDFKWSDTPDFINHLNDLVPNAALVYSFSTASNLRLAYQMRISRPSVNQINPYERQIIVNTVDKGNPDLSSEKANKITLTYSNFGMTAGGNIGVEYSSVDNAIAQYVYSIGDITYNSYANIGYNRNFAVFGFFNWSAVKRMQLSVNARLTRQMFSAGKQDLHNAGWSITYGANWNYSLVSGYKFNAYGGHTTRNYNLQGYSNGWYYYGIGISKDFLSNKSLTVALNANNFLQSHSTYRNYSHTPILTTRNKITNNNWNVGMSVTWNFGNLKSDVKKTSASINNDDQSAVGGKSGTGL